MKTINVTYTAMSDQLLKQTPCVDHYDVCVDEDCRITSNGETLGVYVRIEEDFIADLRAILPITPVNRGQRSNGIPTRSAIYGALPRTNHRNAACRWSAHTQEAPELFERIIPIGAKIAEIYEALMPARYAEYRDRIENSIVPDWRMGAIPFTTCNLNLDHAIRYHRDRGNFRSVWSNVLILSHGISGGQLVFPEFRIALSQRDRFLAIFDGQRWIHGCMPVHHNQTGAYRCSAVFYALAAMKDCYPYEREYERVLNWRTAVEERYRPSENELHSGGTAANLEEGE